MHTLRFVLEEMACSDWLAFVSSEGHGFEGHAEHCGVLVMTGVMQCAPGAEIGERRPLVCGVRMAS